MLRAAVALAILLCVPAAEAANPRYRFVAETTSTTVVTSTCTARQGGAATTESLTWELRSRQSGTSGVGRGTRAPRGRWKLTGTILRETARETQGFDAQPPQGGTEPLQESQGTEGLVYRRGKRLELRLSHGGLLDPTFVRPAPGKSVTIVQDPPAESSTTEAATTEGGSCSDSERTDVVRRITVTRLR